MRTMAHPFSASGSPEPGIFLRTWWLTALFRRFASAWLEGTVSELFPKQSDVPCTVLRFENAPIDTIQAGRAGPFVREQPSGCLIEHGIPREQVKEVAEPMVRLLRGLFRKPSLHFRDRGPTRQRRNLTLFRQHAIP